MKKVKLGDVFTIPLSSGKLCYGQYQFESKFGPIVQIYNLKTEKEINYKEVILAPKLFPPVIVGLFAAIRDKLWKVIGNIPIIEKNHPIFISTFWDNHGNASIWKLWDGMNIVKIGMELPKEYKQYEYLIVYPPTLLMERIETGKIPFPYGDLITNNKFTPRV